MTAPSPISSASKGECRVTARSSKTEASMIARVWHGVTPAARAEQYAAYLRQTGIADCRATPGNRGVDVLRRLDGDRAHFLFVSFWESLNAIRAFAGDDIRRARYYPEDPSFLLELEPMVRHYELFVD